MGTHTLVVIGLETIFCSAILFCLVEFYVIWLVIIVISALCSKIFRIVYHRTMSKRIKSDFNKISGYLYFGEEDLHHFMVIDTNY